MRIVVFGAGGVGGYFGGRLAHAGENVTFIARGEHLQAMLIHGLKVESISGDFIVQPVNATQDTTMVTDVDAILCCVKAWQIPEAARAMVPMLGPDTFVVPLENGVEAPAQLSAILGKERVLGGLCRIASRVAFPGVIQHTGIDPYVAFGELDHSTSVRADNLLQAFQHAGVTAEVPADIQAAVWRKFLFISAVSGMGAVTRVPFGLFRAIPGTRQLLQEAVEEAYAVAIAEGIRLPAEIVADTLAFIDSLPPNTTASMQRDILEGRPSELEAQNGTLVRLGHQLAIPTPVNTFIYNCLLPQENLARGSNP